MIPTIRISPISENVVIIEGAGGIAIQVSDGGPVGMELQIAKTREDLRFARYKLVKIECPFEADENIHVEMKSGIMAPRKKAP